MQLDGATNGLDINTLIDFLSDSDDTAFPVARKVHLINAGLEELIGEIISADGSWQYDDTNHTDEPVGRATLVEGQQRYSFSSEYLDITMIEILNKDGIRYQKLKPLDYTQLGDISPEEYFGTESDGSPKKGATEYYDKIGDTIYLYPAPAAANVTLTNGLRVWFKRTVDLFTASDTTQEPGLPSPYHSILAYMTAIPYCMKYHKDRVVLYQNKVTEMKKNLLKFYARREKDVHKVATMRPITFR